MNNLLTNRISLTLVLVLACAPLLRAQGGDFEEQLDENPQTLKQAAVAQIFEYGQNVYERGDYEEAANVFRHILKLDASFTPAQTYLDRMKEPGPRTETDIDLPPMPYISSSENNADLKQQIAEEERAIHILKSETSLSSETVSYE